MIFWRRNEMTQPPLSQTTVNSVTLRPVAPEDKARLFDWRNRPDVRRYMYNDQPIAIENHEKWFAGLGLDTSKQYFIIQLNNEPVGLVNLVDIDLKSRKAAWAYYLAEPQVRGRGVGAYVEFWMIDHVFDTLGLNKLWCEVVASNEAVWKLHQSFGFEIEARYRQHVIRSEGPEDVLGLGLLAKDWAKVRPACRERLLQKGYAV